MTLRRTFAACAWLLLCTPLLFATGCSERASPTAPDASARLRIVATTPMLGDLAAAIAEDRADVVTLMGSGVDPHLFRPTRTDVERIVAADVVLANGLLLEGRLQDALDRAAAAGRTVLRAGDAIPEAELLQPEGAEGHPDPHIWMDPLLWTRSARAFADVLAERDPAQAAAYRAAAERFERDATALHERITAAIATLPPERRLLVTAHDAFGYFGRRYGLEVHGLLGLSTESEAGLADVEALVRFIVERRVPAVFVESTISPRSIEALVAGAKARGHDVRIGGELFSDSMGRPGTPEATWIGMLEHNRRTIVDALTPAAQP